MKNPPLVSVGIVMLAAFAGLSHAQTYYQCKDASGTVRFSDRACKVNTAPISVESSTGVVTPERKAASDARIQRDSALASQAEAQRSATEQAAAAAQGQQVQSSKAIAGSLEQERAQRASTTNSVIPSGGTVFTPAGQ